MGWRVEGVHHPARRARSTRLLVLQALDVPARVLARVGLHRVNSAGRRIVERLTADRLSVAVEDFRLSGRVAHRGYLYTLEGNGSEPYMASVFGKVLKPGMVVVDVGAFIGYYTIKAGLAVGPTGTVFSLEPDPGNFTELEVNVKGNGTAPWTMVLQSAAADRDGELPFFVDRWDPSQSGMGGFRSGTTSVVVPTTRLDTLLREAHHVDVLKIDTEGFEMATLAGLEDTVSRMQGRPMTMFVECFPEALRTLGTSPEAMLDWLRNHGFSVGLVDEGTKSITPLDGRAFDYGNWFCTTSDAIWRAIVDSDGALRQSTSGL